MAITTTFDAPLENDPDNVFDTKAFDTMGKLNPWADEANALAVEVNGYAVAAAESETNASASESAAQQFAANAQSATNFEGPWSTLTGAKLAGISVTHLTTVDGNDRSWRLKVDVADITLSEPGTSSDWFEITVYPPLEGVEQALTPSSVTVGSFSSPGGSPTGLTFDGTNLISCDSTSDTIYIHDGVSGSILSSFSSPGSVPRGLTFDGTNLISCDSTSDTIYIHDGVSGSILSSFSSPGSAPTGLTFDGTNLISCDPTSDTIYIHDGVSGSILSSFSSPGSVPIDLTFDGTNLISCDSISVTIYIHAINVTGDFSGSISTSKSIRAGHISLGTSSVISTPDATSFDKTITGNTTFIFTNPGAGSYGFILEITNGAAFAVSWPSNVEWSKGVIPALQVAGKDKLVFITHDNGVTWSGSLSQEALA